MYVFHLIVLSVLRLTSVFKCSSGVFGLGLAYSVQCCDGSVKTLTEERERVLLSGFHSSHTGRKGGVVAYDAFRISHTRMPEVV